MFNVTPSQHPAGSLLQACEALGAYADCYYIDIRRQVSQSEFIAAFYTTAAFKVERAILRLVLSRPSTDREAQQLASGETESFAIWTVEGRNPNQILLKEFTGRTKSWLMAEPFKTSTGPTTRLFFGSAVMPQKRSGSYKQSLGGIFYCLLWFHKLYSQILLASAKSKLASQER